MCVACEDLASPPRSRGGQVCGALGLVPQETGFHNRSSLRRKDSMNRSRPSTSSLMIAAAGLMASALFTVSAAPTDPQGPHVLQVRLSPTGATPAASGKAKFRFVRQYSRFTVEAHGLLPGSYDILIGGGAVGTMNVGAEDSADAACRFTLDSRLAGGFLFDPRGTTVEVVNHVTGVTE